MKKHEKNSVISFQMFVWITKVGIFDVQSETENKNSKIKMIIITMNDDIVNECDNWAAPCLPTLMMIIMFAVKIHFNIVAVKTHITITLCHINFNTKPG